ncbi:hypothetical protein BC939DRAFT_489069 [Gamsiella multidivaricata]|uniref:uncharacterized protein n=1 Tax=Gamsiella multidivaricata TaxID=101098 RepID=UPI00221E54A8|nr:uncharacterized protein BC939DRAFT_489069 [Gamsiella multidivaricata]KAI7831741.1 hypothetical protein BC939DRAFT_489069 [Gamsiella multidivaricata]
MSLPGGGLRELADPTIAACRCLSLPVAAATTTTPAAVAISHALTGEISSNDVGENTNSIMAGENSPVDEVMDAKEQILAEALKRLHVLQRLCMLDTTNLSKYFYESQREELHAVTPTLRDVRLY